jgi:hypothetical protein
VAGKNHLERDPELFQIADGEKQTRDDSHGFLGVVRSMTEAVESGREKLEATEDLS